MRRITFIFLMCVVLLGSCSPVKHLAIEKIVVSEFRMESSTKANVTFDFLVGNGASYPVSLVFTEATVTKDMDLFATIALKDTVSVAPVSRGHVKVPVEITLCDPMSLLSMGLNIKNWDIDEFVVNGKMVLCGKGKSKTVYKIKEKPLGVLLKKLEK
jgi:hypothetical protein